MSRALRLHVNGRAAHNPEPPHSITHEMSVCGSLLLDAGTLPEIRRIIGPDDFYRSDHREIFNAVAALADAGHPVDLVTVPEHLRRAGLLADVGGVAYLVELAECVPSAANAAHYAETIRTHGINRSLVSLGTSAAAAAWTDGAEPAALLADVQARIAELSARAAPADDGSHTLSACAAAAINEAAARRDDPTLAPITSGFAFVDDACGGFLPGELWLLAARPGVGKSAWAVQWAALLAARGIPGLYVSLEMRRAAIAARVLGGEVGADVVAMRRGRMRRDDEAAMRAAQAGFASWPLLIRDNATVDVHALRAWVSAARPPLKWVVVDYLQLIGGPENRNQTRNDEVGAVSRGLKALAMDAGVVVLALSQLNRDGDEAPRLRHLRESGSLEQDADGVLALHRPAPWDRTLVRCSILKARDGGLAENDLRFNPRRLRFDIIADGNVPDHDPSDPGNGSPF